MITENKGLPKAAMPWRLKALIAVLLCLQIPIGIFFFPLAAVLVLTGILAPLGMMCFTIARKPSSLAMKCRADWQSQRGQIKRPQVPQR